MKPYIYNKLESLPWEGIAGEFKYHFDLPKDMLSSNVRLAIAALKYDAEVSCEVIDVMSMTYRIELR